VGACILESASVPTRPARIVILTNGRSAGIRAALTIFGPMVMFPGILLFHLTTIISTIEMVNQGDSP
jgi:hypothetical protein